MLLEYEEGKAEVVVDTLLRSLGVSLRDRRVLEVGCSTGVLMRLLEEQGAVALGVDVRTSWSDQYSCQPERRIFLDLQIEDPPPEWQDTPFDLVIAQEVIEHIERPYDFLRRLQRVIAPGGYLFLTTPNLLGLTAFVKGRQWCGLATEGHVILYSAKSLDFTVCQCGFRVVKTFTNMVPIYHQARRPWLRWANRALMWTGAGGGIMGLYQRAGFPARREPSSL